MTVFRFLDAKTSLNDIHEEIAQKEEQKHNIERERLKLMSDLALQMQTKVRTDYIVRYVIIKYKANVRSNNCLVLIMSY